MTSLSSKVPYVQPEDILLDRLIAQASFTAITTWNYKDEDGNVAKVRETLSNRKPTNATFSQACVLPCCMFVTLTCVALTPVVRITESYHVKIGMVRRRHL